MHQVCGTWNVEVVWGYVCRVGDVAGGGRLFRSDLAEPFPQIDSLAIDLDSNRSSLAVTDLLRVPDRPCRVDVTARICVRQSYYSVLARYAGCRLEVRLGATMITVNDGDDHR